MKYLAALCLTCAIAAAASSAAPPGRWQVVRIQGRYEIKEWWSVRGVSVGGNGGEEYEFIATNSRLYSQCIAEELERRKLGPWWHRGMFGHAALETKFAIERAAFEECCRREKALEKALEKPERPEEPE